MKQVPLGGEQQLLSSNTLQREHFGRLRCFKPSTPTTADGARVQNNPQQKPH